MKPRRLLPLALLFPFACAHSAVGTDTKTGPFDPRQVALVGCDETTAWDDTLGLQPAAPGADELLFIDLSNAATPKVQARLPLRNSVYGPPTNLVMARSGAFALVASSIRVTLENGKWMNAPDNEVHVLDLKGHAQPVVTQLKVGAQPSGIDIAPDETMALVANRKGRSVSVIDLRTQPFTVVAEIPLHVEAADVKFTPDGAHALVSNYDAHSVTLLAVKDHQVSVGARLEVGNFPYSVAITPNGRLALVGNMGDKTGGDGADDTVSVIDLQAQPPRVVAHVPVGDGPEGLALSPDGKLAAVVVLNGSNASPTAPYYHPHGVVRLLALGGGDGTQVSLVGTAEVGTMAEGARFTADGSHIIAGNFRDRNLTVLKVENQSLNVAGHLPLGCRPGSLK